jgi:hypothetical protein
MDENTFDEQMWLDFLNLILNPDEARRAADTYGR